MGGMCHMMKYENLSIVHQLLYNWQSFFLFLTSLDDFEVNREFSAENDQQSSKNQQWWAKYVGFSNAITSHVYNNRVPSSYEVFQRKSGDRPRFYQLIWFSLLFTYYIIIQGVVISAVDFRDMPFPTFFSIRWIIYRDAHNRWLIHSIFYIPKKWSLHKSITEDSRA